MRTLQQIVAVCGVLALALVSMPTPAFGASTETFTRGTTEIQPLQQNAATEWQLGPSPTKPYVGRERPAELYLVTPCFDINAGNACPGVLIIVWHSIHGDPVPTVIRDGISAVEHVYRTGLNTYRLAVITGRVYMCAGAECNQLPQPGHRTLRVDTWARTVTG